MELKNTPAAELLEGKTLPNGWRVNQRIVRKNNKTGGVYSFCYEVENNGKKGFLKAFDYSGALKIGNQKFSDQMRNILDAYMFERDILSLCRDNKCKNIITLMDHGAFEIEDPVKYPRVEYLILEYADNGDVRDALEEKNVTVLWKVKSLHQLAKALNQIHRLNVAHQDIKPSNIVSLQNGLTKLTDFGSAVELSKPASSLPYHLQKDCAGSWEYAPPDILYGEISQDSVTRRIGCDLYLLGSMVAFYFTNSNMTSLIRDHLQEPILWTDNKNYGKFQSLKSYIVHAYELALDDIRNQIDDVKLQEWVVDSIRYLCHPDPESRGHIKTRSELGPKYALYRFITLFDRMVQYLKYK